MTSVLVRMRYVNPSYDNIDSLGISDEALSRDFKVTVFEIDSEYADRNKISFYGRDVMSQWGDVLFVHPKLVSPLPYLATIFFQKLLPKSGFVKFLRNNGYTGRIVPYKDLCEEGMFIPGKEFFLISNDFDNESSRGRLQYWMNQGGLSIPFHFVPPASTLNSHIDLDYAVVDAERIIYASPAAMEKDHIKQSLEEIASSHDYELRVYPDTHITSYDESALFKSMRGINFIACNRTIYTCSVNRKEKEQLKRRNIKVQKVPLGMVNAGAALRCVYGQYNT
jgi:hypothetical protein